MTRSRFAVLATLLAIAGCALYNEVSIAPLNMNPLMIDHGADVQGMVRKADYLRAVEYASTVESRTKPSAPELGALGSAELSSGRYDNARKHLRIENDPEQNPLLMVYVCAALEHVRQFVGADWPDDPATAAPE